jgi:hypothetical protein
MSRLIQNANNTLPHMQQQSYDSSRRHDNTDINLPLLGLDLRRLGKTSSNPSQVIRSPSVPKTVRTANKAYTNMHNDDLSDIKSVLSDERPSHFRLPDCDDNDSRRWGQWQQQTSLGGLTYGSPPFAKSLHFPTGSSHGDARPGPIVPEIARFQKLSFTETTPSRNMVAGTTDNIEYRRTIPPPQFALPPQGLARFQATRHYTESSTNTETSELKNPCLPDWLGTPRDENQRLFNATPNVSQFVDEPNQRDMQQRICNVGNDGIDLTDFSGTDIGIPLLSVVEQVEHDEVEHIQEENTKLPQSPRGGIAPFHFGGPTEDTTSPSKYNNDEIMPMLQQTAASRQFKTLEDPSPPTPINQVSPHLPVRNPDDVSKPSSPPFQYAPDAASVSLHMHQNEKSVAKLQAVGISVLPDVEVTPTSAGDKGFGDNKDGGEDVCSADLPDTYRSDDSMNHPLPPVMRHPDFSTNRSGIKFFIGNVQVDMRGKALNDAEQGQVDALLSCPPPDPGKSLTSTSHNSISLAKSYSSSTESSNSDCSGTSRGVVSKQLSHGLIGNIYPASITEERSKHNQSKGIQSTSSACKGIPCKTNPPRPSSPSRPSMKENSSSDDDDSFSSIQHLLEKQNNLWV